MPNMILNGFCKEVVIFTAYAAEQNYQNLYQLFFRPVVVCMAAVFYLPAIGASAAVGAELAAHKTIRNLLQSNGFVSCHPTDVSKLGD